MIEAFLLKHIGYLVSPFKWLYNLAVDQTLITIEGQAVLGEPDKLFAVVDRGNRSGYLNFSILTSAEGEVELLSIQISYTAPLQLTDPGNRGFFKGAMVSDQTYPFALVWTGNVIIRKDLLQMFAVETHFPTSLSEAHVTFKIRSRRIKQSIGGYRSYGREHERVLEQTIHLTNKPITGLRLPPKTGFSTPQRFFVESGMTLGGQKGDGPILVHQRFDDGTVSTEEYQF